MNIPIPRYPIAAALFLALVLVTVGSEGEINDDHFLSVTKLKHQRLESAKSPKIVFIGGSNLAFGLDSKCLEQKLKQPVINMGLSAGLGLRYMIAEVEPFLGSGDLCIIVPEYEHFYSNPDDEPSTLLAITRIYPRAVRFLDRKLQMVVAKGYADLFKKRVHQLCQRWSQQTYFSPLQRQIYSRQGFNEYGDMVAHNGLKRPDWAHFELLKDHSRFNSDTVKAIGEFNERLCTRDCKLAVAFPPIPIEQYQEHKPQIDFVYQRLAAIPGLTMANTPEANTLPAAAFWDTAYHIKSSEREQRCTCMCCDINRCMHRK